MVKALCTSGNCEVLKLGVHGASGVIAAAMAAYNIAAACFRRDRHLKINAVVYVLLVGYEFKQTMHHFKACHPAAPADASSAVAQKCA